MVTNLNALDDRMTEIAITYLNKGYRLSPRTIKGSDVTSRIDLIKGKELIRIWYRDDTSYDFRNRHPEIILPKTYHSSVITFSVGKGVVDKYQADGSSCIWTDDLLPILEEYYYVIGRGKNRGITTDINDVKHSVEIQDERIDRRYEYLYGNKGIVHEELPYLKIAFRAVKKLPKTKTIHLEHIKNVKRQDSGWLINYETPSGRDCNYKIYMKGQR